MENAILVSRFHLLRASFMCCMTSSANGRFRIGVGFAGHVFDIRTDQHSQREIVE